MGYQEDKSLHYALSYVVAVFTKVNGFMQTRGAVEDVEVDAIRLYLYIYIYIDFSACFNSVPNPQIFPLCSGAGQEAGGCLFNKAR